MITERCGACGKERDIAELIETPLYFVCQDQDECIAEFSGWKEPPTYDAACLESEGGNNV